MKKVRGEERRGEEGCENGGAFKRNEWIILFIYALEKDVIFLMKFLFQNYKK